MVGDKSARCLWGQEFSKDRYGVRAILDAKKSVVGIRIIF